MRNVSEWTRGKDILLFPLFILAAASSCSYVKTRKVDCWLMVGFTQGPSERINRTARDRVEKGFALGFGSLSCGG